MKLATLAGASTGAYCLFCLSLPARADFTVCNKTAEKVSVAVAYVSPKASNMITEGWWSVPSCGCETVVIAKDTSDLHTVYVFGNGKTNLFEGESRFCTQTKAFKIIDAENDANCRKLGGTFKKFILVKSESGNHTHDLTGGANCPNLAPKPAPVFLNSEKICNEYADTALKQIGRLRLCTREFKPEVNKFPARWDNNRRAHFDWCRTTAQLGWLDGERNNRDTLLSTCGAGSGPAVRQD